MFGHLVTSCVILFYYSKEVDNMATRSILTNVNINNKQLAKGFVDALSNAEKKHSKDVVMSKKIVNVEKGKIKDYFSK